ncbi:PREDICTED: transmembrane protein 246-like [Amphimedon queenslandica]|uniref:Uncharacterized protein n=1 Tax=Amphimedon queenslandica TaxID=400682 RepID=A0A1X7UQV5_AMPQE|nr:PREDICTED: transmembrane protein 246-like [Amphimedon queenslandica]|eukprot:XP_011404315.1 PREDICTED: transmembrane protein 246-like [Amphimedon queenslandica]
MKCRRLFLFEGLYLLFCAFIVFIVMPQLCKRLAYSLYYDPPPQATSIDQIQTENKARLHSAQQYLLQNDLHYLFDHFKLNQTKFCFVIITIPREGSYLTQTAAALIHQLSFLSNFTFTVYNLAAAGTHSEAFKLSSKIPVTNSRNLDPPPGDKFIKEKLDYLSALRWCHQKKSIYNIVLEDDAMADPGFAHKLNFILRYCLKDTTGDTWGLMKLYYPEKYQGWGNNRSCIGELLVLTVLLGGTLVILSGIVLPSPIDWWQFKINETIFKWRLLVSLSLVLYLILSFGRPHWEEVRKLSPFLINVVPARGCCTPAVLYPRSHLQSLIDYLDSFNCTERVPVDIAIDSWIAEKRLNKLLAVPNLFNHIGLMSSLPKGMKPSSEFHLLFPPK